MMSEFVTKHTKSADCPRTTFGGYVNTEVIAFENRERTMQVFAWFAQNSLDEEYKGNSNKWE